jgi:hypothetical protein
VQGACTLKGGSSAHSHAMQPVNLMYFTLIVQLQCSTRPVQSHTQKRAAYNYQIFENCGVKGADNSSVITCTLGSQCFAETKGPTSINDTKKSYGTLMIEAQNKMKKSV